LLVSSLAWRVEATSDRYRFTVATWRRGEDGVLFPNTYRPRVEVSPSSLGRAQVSFTTHRGMRAWEFVKRGTRRENHKGRVGSLSELVAVTTGQDQLTLGPALALYGIPSPVGTGSDGLAAELDALCRLYPMVLADFALWPRHPIPDRAGSAAALGK